MNVRVTYRRRGAATLVLLALAMAISAACTTKGSSSPRPSSTQTSTTPMATADPSVTDAEQQARAAYTGYIQTWALASQTADPDNPDLARYAADPLLSLTRHNIRTLRGNGQVQVGAQKATVLSAKVDLAASPPTVTINACLDYSELKLVYKSNQSPVTGSEIKNPRVSAVVTVAKYTTGQWLVNESKQGRDPC